MNGPISLRLTHTKGAVIYRLTDSFVLASGIVLAWHKSSFTGIEGHLAVGARH